MHAVGIDVEWPGGDDGGKVVHTEDHPPGSSFSFLLYPVIILPGLSSGRVFVDFMQGQTVGDATADASIDPGIEGGIGTEIVIDQKNVTLQKSERWCCTLRFRPLAINSSRFVCELEASFPGLGIPRAVRREPGR